MFAYHQELFLMGNPISIISIVLSCAIGLFCMCACFEGYIFRKLTVVERVLMALCAICGIDPGFYGHFLLCYLYRRGRRTVHAEQKSEESSNLKTKRNLC